MGIVRDIGAAPFSWLYGLGLAVRHFLYNVGVFKSQEYDIPIICVGNITVGGTGKTPTTEYLIEILNGSYNVAVLSRGYKRKTKGFILAREDMSYRRIGDEPKQIKIKFPTIPVAVCESRREGIAKLREHHPEVNLIILDDAFQHRAVEAWVNIILIDYNNPIYNDSLLPLGRLRDFKGTLHRANMVIITKCPEGLTPLDCRLVRRNLVLYPYQTLYFTRFRSGSAYPLFPELIDNEPLEYNTPVVLVASIANPTGFIHHVEQNYALKGKVILPDHHAIKMSNVAKLEAMIDRSDRELNSDRDDGAARVRTRIVMTEKDAVKFLASKKISEETRSRMYCISISMTFADHKEEKFQHILSQFLKENQKYNITHPE